MHPELLNMLVWNCHSIYNKLSNFKIKLYSNRPHVVCLTETWIKDNREPCFINYSKYLCNRETGQGGGLAILIRNDLINAKKDVTPFPNGYLEVQAVLISSYKNNN